MSFKTKTKSYTESVYDLVVFIIYCNASDVGITINNEQSL